MLTEAAEATTRDNDITSDLFQYSNSSMTLLMLEFCHIRPNSDPMLTEAAKATTRDSGITLDLLQYSNSSMTLLMLRFCHIRPNSDPMVTEAAEATTRDNGITQFGFVTVPEQVNDISSAQIPSHTGQKYKMLE